MTLDINGGTQSSGVSSAARLNVVMTSLSLSLIARVHTCLTESDTCPRDTCLAHSRCPPGTPAGSGQRTREHTRHKASSAPAIDSNNL